VHPAQRSKILAVVTALTSIVACSTLTSAPRRGPLTLTPRGEDWDRALLAATRRHEDYYWAMRQADLRATLITPVLRAAFLKEREEFHGRFAEQTQRELVGLGDPDEGVDAPMKPAPDAEQQVVIFVAMYVADQKNRDLAAGYSVWDVRLERGDTSVKPIKIESVRLSPAVQEVFPYVDRFDDLYLMRFPLLDSHGTSFLAPGKEPLRLSVKSALAETTVEWVLAE
jgi:hypothetical protein